MPSAADLSRRYIEAHNSQDIDRLIALVADDVDFKRPDEPTLTSRAQVLAQYTNDWSTHSQVPVEVLRLMWRRSNPRGRSDTCRAGMPGSEAPAASPS